MLLQIRRLSPSVRCLSPDCRSKSLKKSCCPVSWRPFPAALLLRGDMTRRNQSMLVALCDEEPKMLIRLLRSLWPDIRAAMDRGHTLKVIHERLAQDGISISYRQFCAYVARLRRERGTSGKGQSLPTRHRTGTSMAQDS